MTIGSRHKNLTLMRRRRSNTGSAAQAAAAAMPMTDKPVLILFSDDSTLIFARRMRDALHLCAPDLEVQMVWHTGDSALSYRQISQLLPEGPDRILSDKGLRGMMKSPNIQAIITSRVYRAMIGPLKSAETRWAANRPCIVSFLGGLDFFPELGFTRRRNSDVVYLFPHGALADYAVHVQGRDNGWQDVGFGHPSVMMPDTAPADLDQRRDIFFFPQALSPLTKRARVHMLRMMAAVARANPDRRVYIKLRHLPDENREHLHQEKYDYPGLMSAIAPWPDNLLLTDITMEQALETAALGITCTSTAALDLISAGLPCMVYLDFIDAYRDPLVAPMRRLFKDSGVIASTEQVLNLAHRTPETAWMNDMFCPRDLGARVLDSIADFHARDFQIKV